MKKGKVYLVGAGPGDPGLMTVRGSECLRRAEVVVYDHLVNPVILGLASRTARLVYAGKSSGEHTLTQERINRLLISEARRGKTVVRLKGGDPILFGRGAEEGLELSRHVISFEIVPGVTSALAVPAAAGIPLTFRSLSSTVTVVTGHEAAGGEESAVAWERLLDERSTVVVLMGVANLRTIVRRLGHRDMPAAVIRAGTLPSQMTVVGTLGTIADRVEQAGLQPPAVLVAGRVVGIREALRQRMHVPFLPLSGRHILVTRPLHAAEEFSTLLRDRGASVTQFPLIRIVPSPASAVDPVIRELPSFRWVVLSSAGGADLFAAALKRNGIPVAALRGTGIAAIGPKTAERLRRHGLSPSLVPGIYRQEALAESFGRFAGGRKGDVLLLHAQESREVLEARLREQGFGVTACDLYRIRAVGGRAGLKAVLSAGVDAVTITCSTTARSLARLLDDRELRPFRRKLNVAAIGPVCAETARSLGLNVSVVAEEYTIEGLAAALAGHFATTTGPVIANADGGPQAEGGARNHDQS